jgi:hypothetical protein
MQQSLKQKVRPDGYVAADHDLTDDAAQNEFNAHEKVLN